MFDVESYAKRGDDETLALDLVIGGCALFDVYPREVCKGMVNSVGSRLFKILRISNVRTSLKRVLRCSSSS